MDRRDFFQESLLGIAYLSALTSQAQLQRIVIDPAKSTMKNDPSLRDLWQVRPGNAFHEGIEEGAGFSFTFNGKKTGPQLFEKWETSTKSSDEMVSTFFHHASGLLVIREARAFSGYAAIEYTVRFKNESSSSLPDLSSIVALDLGFAEGLTRGVSVVSSGGGMSTGAYPPDQFAMRRHYIGPMVPAYGEVTLTTDGGRSSNRDLPFFFVEHEGSGAGIFVAFGWTGQWSARVAVNLPEHRLEITGSVPGIILQLRPGEEISGPRILVGCYQGGLSEGSNLLRRLIRERYTPAFLGKKPEPLMTYDHWWDIGANFDEKLLRQLVNTAAELGQEYFLLDTGWYTGVRGQWDFSTGLGNWEVDRVKFPSGLRAFADYTRSKGLKFGLWFEPERVAKDSRVAKEHPDWVIWLPEEASQGDFFSDPAYGLLDFGREEVQDWVRTMMARYIDENQIEYLRYDFNLDPIGYWKSHDTPSRRGLSQIRHIEGLNRVVDWIRDRHPMTVMEGCASGGRRIDLEMTRRFHTFWISDYTIDPHILRFHLRD